MEIKDLIIKCVLKKDVKLYMKAEQKLNVHPMSYF